MVRKVYQGKNVDASGPYSHAVDAGEFIYFSGQTAKNALFAENEKDDIKSQTKQCFANLYDVMEEAGVTSDDVVKVNVYLTTMQNFTMMNAEYEKHFNEPFPARTCVAVLELPLGADVEIEVVVKKREI